MLKLIVVQAEYGDCLLLQSSAGGNSLSILIDGGPFHTYEKNLKSTLDTVLPSKNLDLVILSHIDNDNVLGLLNLFEAIKIDKDLGGRELLKVGGLWHNSFKDIIGSNKNPHNLLRNLFLSNQFSIIENDIKIAELPDLGALKGVSEGRDLTILAKDLDIPINPQFGGDIIDTNELVQS